MPPFFPSGFNKTAQRSGKGVDAPVDDQGQTLLHVSVKNGDAEAVARLLQLGANPRQLDMEGRTPLFDAVASKDIALVKLLVDKGASFRIEDDAGNTPLLWAILQKADVPFLEQLQELGMELDFQGKNGHGALQAAAAANSPDVIGYLLKNKVSVDEPDGEGRTALHCAAEAGAHDALRALLECGADPLVRNKEIKTALHLAAQQGDEGSVDILLTRPDVRLTLNDFETYGEGFTPLMAAVAGDHIAIAEKLLDVGAHINAVDHQNRHSLFIAAETGTPAMVKMLISRGADVEKAPPCSDRSQPMLHKINTLHYKETLLLLVAAGADIDGVDSLGQTALNRAAETRDPDRVRALLDLGANPDLASTYGRRPIDAVLSGMSYYPLSAGVLDIVRALLLAHANPGLPPSANMPSAPLHVAARSGKHELVKLLLEHGAIADEPERSTGATPWLAAAGANSLQSCDLLREKGADTAAKDNKQRGVFHYAAQSGANTLIEAALKNPALKGQADTPDTEGSTPLHLATQGQRADCIRALLAAGANPLSYDGAGLTPLHHAARIYNEKLFSCFDTAPKKSDWNVQSLNEKETPLHLAAKHSSANVVQYMLNRGADATLRDNRGYTPLLSALVAGQRLTAKTLVDALKLKNISLDELRDNAGFSPLHVMAQNSVSFGVYGTSLLLDAGANPNTLTPAGDTPLHIAIRHGRFEAARILAERGGDVSLANKTGATPLDLAEESGNRSMIDMMRQALREQQQKKNAPPAPPSAKRPRAPGP